MMNRLKLIITAAAFSLAATSVQAAFFTGTPSPSLSPVFGTLVDFDDQASGTAIGAADYASVGVASITETEGLGTFARYSGSQSAPNYIGTGAGGERGTDANLGWDGTILFEFASLASKVGLGVADSQGGRETMTIFDINMAVIASEVLGVATNAYYWFDTGAFNVKYLQITGDFFAVDDLQFDGGSQVPLPAAIWFLGSGLIGLLGLRRRSKTA